MTALRGALAVVAVLVAAWFVVGIRQAHGIDTATSILTANDNITTSQEAQVRSLMSEADALYPGTEVELLRGRLAYAEGHVAQARRIFTHVGHEEPENVQPWLLLAATGGPGVDAAFSHVARLVPKIHRR